MGLAAFLWYQRHPIIRMEWTDWMCRWTFSETPDLQHDIAAFDSGEAAVDPKDYWPKMQEFRRLVYKDKPQP